MNAPTILLTGGTGKTGSRIAAQLAERNISFRIASRTIPAAGKEHVVRFVWEDPSSYGNALAGISAVYLVAPANSTEPLSVMQPFLEQALDAGIRRFVLLSASSIEEGGPMMGKVHAYLRRNAPQWAVLRPTWFMQNFSEQQHLPTIRDEGRIYTATGDGRIPFIDAQDIAAAGVAALTSPLPLNRDVVITGPRALTYDEAAETIGRAIGRPVEHVRLTEDDLARRFRAMGLSDEYARTLAAMDTAISQGAEERVTDEVRMLTGRPPSDFTAFAMRERQAWLNTLGNSAV